MLTSAINFVSNTPLSFFSRALSSLQLPVIEELRREFLPTIFPNLPKNNVLKDTILVCGQHLLSNIVPMFNEFQQEGAKKIFVVGKSYSNNKDAISQLKEMNNLVVERSSEQLALGGFSTSYTADVNAMWRRCMEYIASLNEEEKQKCKIIVLDDGGNVLANIPSEIQGMSIPMVGIEQTSSGVPMAETIPCPTIEVATSAVKAWFEPEWVAEKIALEIEKRKPKIYQEFPEYASIFNNNPIIGIVGLGNIGMEILKQFTKRGYKRFVIHDLDNEKIKQAMIFAKQNNLRIETVGATPLVISGADIIIGCTGKSVLTPELDELKVIRMPKIFVSASSRDIEFLPLLRHIQIHNRNDKNMSPLEDRKYRNGFGADILLVNGGTPVNFTRESESVPTDRIQLIRGLKILAVWQARKMMMNQSSKDLTCAGNYMLFPEGQVSAVRAFAKIKPDLVKSVLERKSLFGSDNDILRNAIIRDSGGDIVEKRCPQPLII